MLSALTQFSDLGASLGDDLVLVEAATGGLEVVITPDPSQDGFGDRAVRVFSRLPDELIVRAVQLARRVAAQVGGDHPEILRRVIRLAGIGLLDAAAAGSHNRVPADWARRQPEIAPIAPASGTSVADIGSATQLLLAAHTPDSLTAAHLAAWMKSNATSHVKEPDQVFPGPAQLRLLYSAPKSEMLPLQYSARPITVSTPLPRVCPEFPIASMKKFRSRPRARWRWMTPVPTPIGPRF